MAQFRPLSEGEVLLGKYQIIRKVGEGGMAYVYLAKSQGAAGFSRPVVIKVIRPELASSPDLVRQFVQEASVGASLDHPNVVNVFDLGEHEGRLLMVLEYVAGKDLAALTYKVRKTGRVLGPEMVAFIHLDVAKALECAHSHADPASGNPSPVIHRDVSPQNILLSFDGNVKLADFGMARALGMARQTRQGVIKGKLSYMSPEQTRGQEVDARADIFSLGIVLWETLSGQRLFLSNTPYETIQKIREAQVPPLRSVAPHISEELAHIVHLALARDKEARFQTATDLRMALQGFLRRTKPVDPSALSDLLRTYFPADMPDELPADSELSFDDEADDFEEATEIDEIPPEMREESFQSGQGPAHTMLMFGASEALEEAVKKVRAEAEAKKALGQGPGGQPAALPDTERFPSPAANPGQVPTSKPEAPTQIYQPPLDPAGQQPAQRGHAPVAPHAQPIHPPAAGNPAHGSHAQPMHQLQAQAHGAGQQSTPAGQYPAQPQLGQQGQGGGLPKTVLMQGPLPQPLQNQPVVAHQRPKSRTKPLVLSLIVGVPLGMAVGAVIFWLLTR